MGLVAGDHVTDQNGNAWTVWDIQYIETAAGGVEERALVYQCTGGAVAVYRTDDLKKSGGEG